ncbi:MAG: hypothetical protein JWN72_1331, partial [Thermoleophilia bacterium]|nr:hypothetical protein [Thermoleophilia bacterium]
AVTIARGVSALPVLVNELGFLDFLNRGATSDPLTNARDTAVHLLHKLPGLDHALPADVKPAPGEVPA